MTKFRVEFRKDWTECGLADIEAIDEEQAESIAREMLAKDSAEIKWDGGKTDTPDWYVESVEPAVEKKGDGK